MSLSAGARLGPYEIVAPLGAGGMGEVYRAKDGRLNRTVAIKILSDESAADADRRERFEREAKAISALDHPNICALYDVGEHDGTYFLVMPCLEGQTLADRLVKGPLPLDQAIRHAIEIATALDAAHRHGIIHRDLKPGNIVLTKTGVKLLDFGLAKLKVHGPLGATTIGKETGIGVLLGTMPYMAPEQIEGRDVDARSDIFSLGAVIYEMVTGQRAFKGDSPATVIGAILRDEPAPITTQQPLAPASLDHVVATCLVKDPDERWQSAGDVAAELKWIARRGSDVAAAPARRAWPERAVWMAITAVLAAALVAGWLQRTVDTPQDVRLFVTPPPGMSFTSLTTATVPTPQFAISPDGRSIAFVASVNELRPTLWVRSLSNVEARQLAGTNGAREPFWSPDSRWIGFLDDLGTMKRIAVAEGTVHTITSGLSDPRGASWGWNDAIAFGTGFGGIYLVNVSGGESPQELTHLDRERQEGSHRWPQLLPDGTHFLFTVRSALADQRGVYVASRDGSVKRRLFATDGDAQFVAPRTLLFLNGDTLLRQTFDPQSLQLTGTATPIASNVGRSSRGTAALSVSIGGALAYASPMERPSRLTWLDRQGAAHGSVGPEGAYDYVDFRLSPDGSRVAASIVDAKTSVPDLWIADLIRGGATKVTFGPGLSSAPVWAPDGDRIAFRSNPRGVLETFEMSTAMGGNKRILLSEEHARNVGMGVSNVNPGDWSRDGHALVISAGNPADIFMLPLADPTKTVKIIDGLGDQMHPNLSPDGRFIAYTSTESGARFEVHVETLPRSRKWPISTQGGFEPRWRADSKEIYYLTQDGDLMAVPVTNLPQPFGVPRVLFHANFHPEVSVLRTHYVPNRDGSRFLFALRTGVPTQVPITVVLNWMQP
jgi:serine/threonine protein kinase/Tol biopolymer transport system component